MRRPLMLLIAMLTATTASAFDCLDYGTPQPSLLLASHTVTGTARTMAADADILCWAGAEGIGVGTRLHWCRTGADGSLEELGTHLLQRDGADYAGTYLHLDGHLVVAGDAQGGWQVIDFGEPSAPVVRWEAPTGNAVGGPVVWGQRLLVPTAAGIEVLDLVVGGPATRLALLDTVPGRTVSFEWISLRVAVAGNRGWAAGFDQWGDPYIFSIDLSDPEAPAASAALLVAQDRDGVVVRFDSLVAAGDLALATVRTRHDAPIWWYDTCDARFFEARPAGHPALTRTVQMAHTGDAGLVGDRAWVAEPSSVRYFERNGGNWHIRQSIATGNAPRLAVGADAVWTGAGQTLIAWSRTLPESAPLLSVAYQSRWRAELFAVGERLFSRLLDQEEYDRFGWYSWYGVEFDQTDLLCLDASPRFAEGGSDQPCRCVVGSRLYMAGAIWDLPTHTRVSSQSPHVFGAAGNALFTWEEPGFLVTYDATDPAAPTRHRSCFPIGGYFWEQPPVAVANGFAVFAHADTLICTDITTPLEPVVVDRLVLPVTGVRAMEMSDGFLYVAHDVGLTVVGLDGAGALTPFGSVAVGESGLTAILLDGRILYAITESMGRVQLYDVTDPDLPALITEPGISGSQLLLHGDLLYAAGYEITALRRQCPASVPVALTDWRLAWRDGAVHLSWRLGAGLAAVRVLASASGREWIVPWRTDAGGSVAVDERAPRGATVAYRVQILADGGQWLTIAEDSLAVPAALLALAAPVPNPFNPETTLAFTLDAAGPVTVTVLDAAGRVVRTLVRDTRPAGDYEVTWRGDDDTGRPVAAGTYFVRLVAARGERVVKAALVK